MIFWPAEESVSVVKCGDILNPVNPAVGCECQVKVRKRSYAGRLAAIGKYCVVLHLLYIHLYSCTTFLHFIAGSTVEMLALEESYLGGEWTPFSDGTPGVECTVGGKASAAPGNGEQTSATPAPSEPASGSGKEASASSIPGDPGNTPSRNSARKRQNVTKDATTCTSNAKKKKAANPKKKKAAKPKGVIMC